MYNYELSGSHSTWFQTGGPPSSQLKGMSPPGIRWPFDGQTRLSWSLILSHLLQPRKRGAVGGCYSAGMTTPMAEDGRVRAPPLADCHGQFGDPCVTGGWRDGASETGSGRLGGEGASLRSRTQVLTEQLPRSCPGQVAPRFPILQPWLEHSEAGSIIPHGWIRNPALGVSGGHWPMLLRAVLTRQTPQFCTLISEN